MYRGEKCVEGGGGLRCVVGLGLRCEERGLIHV